MAQQTAVEQLENYMIENFHLTEEALYEFKQAKEMEKQQKKAAWVDGIKTQRIIKSTEVDKYFEQYYTQTYGK
jgi:beta-phosphoglucomutase-like phosphatase (HAD superfamily)